MCLILFAYRVHTDYPLVIAANRDELYARPALSAHNWEDKPDVFAGRDLTAGGTWLGVSGSGRFAAVTNFAEESGSDAPVSRGLLTESFLTSDTSAHDFAHHIEGLKYRGFNLLLWDGQKLVYTSNRGTTEDLGPGTYGLANAELGAAWPKVVRGTRSLEALLDSNLGTELLQEALLELLADTSVPNDEELPIRGRPIELERQVAPCFIKGVDYGTRASTSVIIEHEQIQFAEQLYDVGGKPGERSDFQLDLPPHGEKVRTHGD
ncbi:MAG: NRDE family protein [Gammaproteobacteria bacterium]|nr:NRDE family protein [Gammaproteobacteria bacterium]